MRLEAAALSHATCSFQDDDLFQCLFMIGMIEPVEE